MTRHVHKRRERLGILLLLFACALAAPAARASNLVFAYAMDVASGQGVPGAVAILDNQRTNSFSGGMLTIFYDVPDGVHTLAVPAVNGYLAEEDDAAPGQVDNPTNAMFGNPRVFSVANFDQAHAKFYFLPVAQVRGEVRDQEDGSPLAGAGIEFVAQSGQLAGYTFDGYPNFAEYKTNWTTTAAGQFPTPLILPAATNPATRWDLVVSRAGYQPARVTNALVNPWPGRTVDVGVVYLCTSQWDAVFDTVVAQRAMPVAYSGGFSHGKPAAADMDADGDLDLFIGEADGWVQYYENAGQSNSPTWAPPQKFHLGPVAGGWAAPAAADLDADGDLDLFCGGADGGLTFYCNTGSRFRPQWAAPVAGYSNLGVTAFSIPCPADLDCDGATDLLIGSGDGSLTYYRNIGTPSNAAWAAPVAGYSNIHVAANSAPALCDVDADGRPDLFVGAQDGRLACYRNIGTTNQPAWAAPDTNYSNIHADAHSAPAFADLDADGRQDLLLGAAAATLRFYENIGLASQPQWAAPVPDYLALKAGGRSVPALADLDGDGDNDLLAGTAGAGLVYFENAGSPGVERWKTPVAGYAGMAAASNLAPAFCDINADGLQDLFVGNHGGGLLFLKNTGCATQAQWAAATSNYAGVGCNADSAPEFCDIDADGDADLFVGSGDGHVVFLQNTGTATQAAWATPMSNYNHVAVGAASVPRLGDISGDGLPDLLVGKLGGAISYYRNQGTATNAVWMPGVTNYAWLNAAAHSAPALADIDGDGDLDLFSGCAAGGLLLWRNQRPGLTITPPAATVVAGAALQFTAGEPAAWQLVSSASAASINPTNGAYKAGPLAPGLDIVEAIAADGRKGRAHVRVIPPADVQRAGKAIIVAGGRSLDDPVWTATDYLADMACQTLEYRGFAGTNIQYLSFGWRGPGAAKDGFSSLANTAAAFTNFAQDAGSLFVYMVDHGVAEAGGGLRLNAGETLAATNLAAWLNQLQDTRQVDVTVALDCCYAGRFLPALAYTGAARRVVLAATAADGLAYFLAGGAASFSEVMFNGILQGMTMLEAFRTARDAMARYQQAWLDDDGDGQYTPADGAQAAATVLGATAPAGGSIPHIGAVAPNQVVTAGNRVELWAADVAAAASLKRVWCVVVPPSFAAQGQDPIAQLPAVDLPYVARDGRHGTAYAGFSEPGLYAVIYYAEDIWGGLSLPRASYITQAGSEENIILVTGGATNDAAWPACNNISRQAYHTFKARRFDDDHIYFINACTNQEVDAAPSLAALGWAITNWAAQRHPTALTVYLVGQGTNSQLRLNETEHLAAGQLAAWLEQGPGTGALVNVVMEFAGAGGFIPALARTNRQPALVPPPWRRVAIAAAAPGQPVMMGDAGRFSFSQFFLNGIFQGQPVGTAFNAARRVTRRMSGRLLQTAEMDDNGDGLPNRKNSDGRLAATRFIGPAFLTGAEAPAIGNVMPDTLLTNGNILALWAEHVTDALGITNVICVVTPPDYDGASPMPQVPMPWNPATWRYETAYTNFAMAGTYGLAFFAQNSAGESSAASLSSVTRTDNLDPASPDAYEPDNGATNASMYETEPQLHSFHRSNDVDWVRLYALSNQAYDIEALNPSTNTDVVLDLYAEAAGGGLTLLDHVDLFGPGESELAGLDFPAEGIYYIRASQWIDGPWSPGIYELRVAAAAGGGQALLVTAINVLTDGPVPAARVMFQGAVYPLDNNGLTWKKEDLSQGSTWQVGITGQAQGFEFFGNGGNPRQVTINQGLTTASFTFMPYVGLTGSVRDAESGAPLAGAEVRFLAQSGKHITGSLMYYDVTTSDGAIKGGAKAPPVAGPVSFTCAGYHTNHARESV